jgi:hypothetical protein
MKLFKEVQLKFLIVRINVKNLNNIANYSQKSKISLMDFIAVISDLALAK